MMIRSRSPSGGSLSNFNNRFEPFRSNSTDYNPFSRQPSNSRALLEQTLFDSTPPVADLPADLSPVHAVVSVPSQAIPRGLDRNSADPYGIFELLFRPAVSINESSSALPPDDDSVLNFISFLSSLGYALVFFSVLSFFIVFVATVYEEPLVRLTRALQLIIRVYRSFEDYRELFLYYFEVAIAVFPALGDIRDNVFPPPDPFPIRFRRNSAWAARRLRDFTYENFFRLSSSAFGLLSTSFLFLNRKQFRKLRIDLWKRWFSW